jgi:hypothetical protein
MGALWMTLILSDCRVVSHVAFDATQNEFPSAALPERLNGLASCPGTIRLRPFGRLAEEAFLEDYRINLLGAVKTIQVCHAPLKKASLRTAPNLLPRSVFPPPIDRILRIDSHICPRNQKLL